LLWSNLVTALVFLVWCWVGWGLVILTIVKVYSFIQK